MKLMYCRVMRNFIEKKRMERIDEFNAQNPGLFGFQSAGQ